MLDKAAFRVLSRFKAVKRLEGGFHVEAKYQGKKKLPSGNTVYLYSEAQVAARNRKKAKRLEKLTKSIKSLRAQVKRDLTSSDPEKALTALAVGLMDETAERVGSDASAKGDLNEDGEPHFGVTTWTRKHITFGKGGATIKYTGKSGVKHVKKIKDAGLVKALKKAYDSCEEGKDNCIFSGEKAIKAKHVNAYLKTFGITAKDIRGLHANVSLKETLKGIRSKGGKLSGDKKEREKKLKEEFKMALEEVAEDIGHTSSTLRNQYLVPGLEERYLANGTILERMVEAKTAYSYWRP
jgi:DNA topoisomerase IB